MADDEVEGRERASEDGAEGDGALKKRTKYFSIH